MTPDAKVLVDRYEHLRQEVLSGQIGSPLGLGVFLRQGMVGWIQLQSSLTATAPPSPVRRRQEPTPLPRNVTREMTRILTELIMTRKECSS